MNMRSLFLSALTIVASVSTAQAQNQKPLTLNAPLEMKARIASLLRDQDLEFARVSGRSATNAVDSPEGYLKQADDSLNFVVKYAIRMNLDSWKKLDLESLKKMNKALQDFDQQMPNLINKALRYAISDATELKTVNARTVSVVYAQIEALSDVVNRTLTNNLEYRNYLEAKSEPSFRDQLIQNIQESYQKSMGQVALNTVYDFASKSIDQIEKEEIELLNKQ